MANVYSLELNKQTNHRAFKPSYSAPPCSSLSLDVQITLWRRFEGKSLVSFTLYSLLASILLCSLVRSRAHRSTNQDTAYMLQSTCLYTVPDLFLQFLSLRADPARLLATSPCRLMSKHQILLFYHALS